MAESENASLSLEQRLARTVQLRQIPINPDLRFGLSIITSLKYETPEDIHSYLNHIQQEFSSLGTKVQILAADNTKNNSFATVLNSVGPRFGPNIEFTWLSETQPGKIHGLNACLRKAQSPFILSVDYDTTPLPGTLSGLYRKITQNEAGLISAKLVDEVSFSPFSLTNQTWNTGAAYIGRREFFTGFPKIISDDTYMKLITKARGGNFSVAKDLKVLDNGAKHLTKEQRLQRIARWQVAPLQTRALTVVDESHTWKLSQYDDLVSSPSNEKFTRELVRIYRESGIMFPFALFLKMNSKLQKIANKDDLHLEIKKYTNLLLNKPDLCTWNS